MYALQLQYRTEEDGEVYGAYAIHWVNTAPPLDQDKLEALFQQGKTNNDPEIQAMLQASTPRMSIGGVSDPLIAERALVEARASGGMVWATSTPADPVTGVVLIWPESVLFAGMVDLETEPAPAPPAEEVAPEPVPPETTSTQEPPTAPEEPPTAPEPTTPPTPGFAPADPDSPGLAPGA